MLIELIGTKDCSACEMTKRILDSKGVEYQYLLMEDLSDDEAKIITQRASEVGKMSMPIIIVDKDFLTLQEVLKLVH